MCTVYGCDTTPFRDHCIPLLIKSIQINRPGKNYAHMLLLFPSFDFQALYSSYFFSIPRLSNILPNSLAKFDTSRHLCLGDIIFSDNGAVVIVMGSKVRQARQNIDTHIPD